MPNNVSNVYRDNKWLVVPIDSAVFPNRCVKTNEPVESADYPFVGDLLRNQLEVPKSGGENVTNAAAQMLFGRFGEAAVEILSKRRLQYQIGLSNQRRAIAKKRRRYGVGLVIFGPILAVVLAAGSASITEDIYGTPSIPIAIAGGVLGMFFFILGIVLFGIGSISTLRVIRSDGTYVWLEGAG